MNQTSSEIEKNSITYSNDLAWLNELIEVRFKQHFSNELIDRVKLEVDQNFEKNVFQSWGKPFRILYSFLYEKEKQDLVYENERLNLKLSMLLDKSNSSINEQSFIEKDGFVDTSNLDKKINDLNAQINKLNSEIDIIKRESLEWQVQYSEISKEKEELAIELNSKRNI